MAKTDWNRKDFTMDCCGYLSYNGKFVARFKYVKSNKPHFLTFLINNFTPAEYFGRYKNGEAPAEILKTKGYISKNVLHMLKKRGYPLTQAGFRAMMDNEIEMAVQERLRSKDREHA